MKIPIILIIATTLIGLSKSQQAIIFNCYADAQNGSDEKNGAAQETAKRHLDKCFKLCKNANPPLSVNDTCKIHLYGSEQHDLTFNNAENDDFCNFEAIKLNTTSIQCPFIYTVTLTGYGSGEI